MRLSKFSLLAAVLILAAPLSAQAAQTLSLSFTGETAPSITSGVEFYSENLAEHSRAFVGPVTINLSIADYLTNPYVSDFSVQWADPSGAAPFTTGWGGTGSPSSVDPFTVTYLSSVGLTGTGGSIQISSSAGYYGYFDGHFTLDLDYALSGVHGLTTSYLDGGATGSGSVDYYINRGYDPSGGYYEGAGGGEFNISSVSAIATVPEPAAWALMLVGFFSLGAALRTQRRGARLRV